MEVVIWSMMTLVVVVCGMVYIAYVTIHISKANSTLDKASIVNDTNGWWQWLVAKSIGWRTIVLAWIAGLTQAVSLFLSSDLSPWQNLPWEKLFSEKIANYITFAIAVLIPLTHTAGMKLAASRQPMDGQ